MLVERIIWSALSASLSLTTLAVASTNLDVRADQPVDQFFSQESPVALQGILDNIGPNGSKASGAKAGIVVASPSTFNPNYFYTWTRDSALTFKYLVSAYTNGNSSLNRLIEDYVLAQGRIQQIKNPSGDFATGGLGEPKFYVNETAFEGDWGRPQRDGPALRASTLIAYSKSLLSSGQNTTVRNTIWPIISNDLNYVTQNWNKTGFDLWEEVNGSSIFTTAMQHRALVEGSTLAKQLGQSCDSCDSQAPELLCFLQSYWNYNHSTANINLAKDNGRSGLDCAAILTSNHLFDARASCTNDGYQPCQGKALANHKAVVDSMRDIYTINDQNDAKSPGKAAAIGRYPEDVYYGGNPWFLCTSAAAEQLYKAIYQWTAMGSVVVDDVSKAFFQDLLPFDSNLQNGNYDQSTRQFSQVINAAKTYADGFAAIVEMHAGTNGSIAEQFSRDNGTMGSASDLTWSYAAFLTMSDARAGGKVLGQETWGADTVKVPSQCKASAASGTTVLPTATSFPDEEGGTRNGASASGTGGAGGSGTATGSATGGKPTNGATAGRGRPLGGLKMPWVVRREL